MALELSECKQQPLSDAPWAPSAGGKCECELCVLSGDERLRLLSESNPFITCLDAHTDCIDVCGDLVMHL